MSQKLSENGVIPADDLFYLLGGKEKIKVLDATYSVAGGHQSPYDAFLACRIKGAEFFDIDAVADQGAPLPHTLPSPEYFAASVSAMGISNDDHVVIYDQSGAYMASSRVWWMFRVFGHENVYVLEGGLQAWIDQGFGTVKGAPDAPEPGAFTAAFKPEFVVGRNDLIANIETQEMLVLDARPAARFHGMAPEPRSGMRAGHIPKSLNLPFGALLDPETRMFKDDQSLEHIFKQLSIDDQDKVAVSCGSGVTACTVALALFKARRQNSAIYDASWSEWGDEASGTPIEISA